MLQTAVDLDPREYMPTLQLLKQIDFFNGVQDENLKSVLFTLKKQKIAKNRTILFQGEIANQLFIIREGSVSISTKNRGTKLHLAELKAPMYFGEISLLNPTSATATVVAGENGVDLLIISHDAMAHLTKKIPDLKDRIQKVIDQRIESKNQAKKADEGE